MSDSVAVSVPARLHLGFLDLDGALGRRFGSIGLGLDRPLTRVEIALAQHDRFSGAEQDRARHHVAAMSNALGLGGHHSVNVSQAIPSHAGLGSGTQLALAIAAALRRLHSLPLDVRGDARRLGRGARSGVGVALFERGGVVVDGGRTSEDDPPPLVAHLPFPSQWRVLLILDHDRQGIHGSDEIAAFGNLPPFPQTLAAHLCHLTLMRALPALAETDLEPFGTAITEIQDAIGDHFAAAQGGRYASNRVAGCLRQLRSWDIAGIGQSSWGPTGFAFMQDEEQARQIVARLREAGLDAGVELIVARGSNSGARFESTALRGAKTA